MQPTSTDKNSQERQGSSTDVSQPTPQLTVMDVTDMYRNWTKEYKEEHSHLMEEFDQLCNVIKDMKLFMTIINSY